MKYKILKRIEDGDVVAQVIIDTERELTIPFCEDNRHYQEYLEWVAEGNTATVEQI